MNTLYATLPSPLGELLLVGEASRTAKGGTALASLSMTGQRNRARVRDEWTYSPNAFAEIERQLLAYFANELTAFDIEFTTRGDDFQQRVWKALEAVPYGSTTTYGKLAELLGVPRAEVKNLGVAVGQNPLLVVRPCHRVIGTDGTLKGYAGGVERKERLLVLEGALPAQLPLG
ncbi:methylated-DNA--[protein]-cysteine S-methyltransferase [Streptomyces sp. NPDC048309]|uniref:methylated-DNA--[protein]-cysteine S-methyltransferase n=1 Tax=unclassified Streptomyces TaxID=2593676 RepID=UPI00340DEB54